MSSEQLYFEQLSRMLCILTLSFLASNLLSHLREPCKCHVLDPLLDGTTCSASQR